MIKMVIWDQNKPILLYLKIKKLKIQKSEIHKLHVSYSLQWILRCQKYQKSEALDFSGPTCLSEGYFVHILYVKVVL